MFSIDFRLIFASVRLSTLNVNATKRSVYRQGFYCKFSETRRTRFSNFEGRKIRVEEIKLLTSSSVRVYELGFGFKNYKSIPKIPSNGLKRQTKQLQFNLQWIGYFKHERRAKESCAIDNRCLDFANRKNVGLKLTDV